MGKKKIEAAEIIIKLSDGNSFKLFNKEVKDTKKSVDNLSRSEQTLLAPYGSSAKILSCSIKLLVA